MPKNVWILYEINRHKDSPNLYTNAVGVYKKVDGMAMYIIKRFEEFNKELPETTMELFGKEIELEGSEWLVRWDASFTELKD